MARATLEIVASAIDRASPVLNRIGESGRVAAQRVATAWTNITSPLAKITRSFRLVETSILAFLGSRAISGLDKFFDKFGGAQYDAARSRFTSSLAKLGESLGKTLGPKFSDALENLTAWMDRNADGLVRHLNTVADGVFAIARGLGAVWEESLKITSHTSSYIRGGVGGATPIIDAINRGGVRRAGQAPAGIGGPPDNWDIRQGGLLFPAWIQQRTDIDVLRRLAARGPRGGGTSYLRESGFERGPGWETEPPRETFMDRLRNEWTETTRDMEERGLHLARTFQYSLGSALTDTILGVEKASEAFKAFARSVVRAVVEMFVDSAVRRFLGGIVGGISGGGGGGGDSGLILPGGGGPGSLGLGGGGGGGDVHYHINAVDSQSFSQALRRAEMERGSVAKITLNSANHNPTFRRGLQLR